MYIGVSENVHDVVEITGKDAQSTIIEFIKKCSGIG